MRGMVIRVGVMIIKVRVSVRRLGYVWGYGFWFGVDVRRGEGQLSYVRTATQEHGATVF